MILLMVLLIGSKGFAQDSSLLVSYGVVNTALEKIEKEKNPRKRFLFCMSMARSGIESEPLYMLKVGQRLFDVSQRLKDPVTQAISWSFYGQGYRLTGNYIKSLESHTKAIRIAETISDKSVLAYANNQIGHIYKDREESEKAKTFYRNAKYFGELGNNKMIQGYACMNLGAVYLNAKKYDSSLYYSKRALKLLNEEDEVKNLINRELSDKVKLYDLDIYLLTNMGSVYSEQLQFQKAEEYYSIAKTSSRNIETDKRYLHILFYNLSQHFQRKGIMDSTLFYAWKSINIIEQSSFSYLNAKPAKMLSNYYEAVNADSAVKYLKLYLKTNEVINSTRVTQQLQMVSFEEARRREEIQQAEINYRNKVQSYLLIGGLLVAGLFVMMMYRNNRAKQKANIELNQKAKKLEEALHNLSSTQAQLIQSEKMASLGELTAGIAHEIQNPLNFVNNFSEVSNELVDEMNEELAKGDIEEARSIAKDVKQNLEKITHHGKRADAIVKGMLQHSRSGSGQKEPTDINQLCDEYLRLAYHGLRAKDKSFNATLKIEFDEKIGLVNLLPQDIGRVVLNLITNAFYAVAEKAKQGIEVYEPMVTVSTKKLNNQIEIKVSDNGNGIPQEITDKIFQPFFTTKPTGQGTGLGLSLSYDIVKAHGGEIKLNSLVGQGTSFVIYLPKQ